MKTYDKKTFIGTANLGEKYGPKFRNQKFPYPEIPKLLDRIANDSRMFIDTADSYQNAEELIGKFAPGKLNNKIATKIAVDNRSNAKTIIKQVKESLSRVKQEIFFSVMLHNTEAVTLPSFKEIYDGLEECVKQGVTNHIGLSSYEVSPILEVRAKYGLMTQYQIQENILSRSNLNNLDLIYLSRNSTSIYVRSIFLQGVLLCSLANLPEFFLPEYSVFEKFEKYSEVTGISKFRLCINYAKSLAWSSGIVAGVSSLTEYETLVSEIYSPTCKTQIPNFVLNSFYSDPRNWNKN